MNETNQKANLSGHTIVYVSACTPEEDTGLQLIKAAGPSILAAKDGSRAMTVEQGRSFTWKPTAFLVDLRLPDLSGFELSRRLAQKWSAKGVPIFLMSNYVAQEDLLEACAANASALLKKPLTAESVEKALEQERMRRLKAEIGDLVISKQGGGSLR